MSWRIRDHLRAFPITWSSQTSPLFINTPKVIPCKLLSGGEHPQQKRHHQRGVKSGCKCYHSNHMSRLAMTIYKGFRTWAFSFRGMHLSKPLSKDFAANPCSFGELLHGFWKGTLLQKSFAHILSLPEESDTKWIFCLPTSNRSGSCRWSSRVLRWGFIKSKNTRFQTITKERGKWESPKKSAPSIKGLLKNARKYVQESKIEWQDAPNLSKFVYRTCSKKNGLNNHPRHPRSKGHSDPSLNVERSGGQK